MIKFLLQKYLDQMRQNLKSIKIIFSAIFFVLEPVVKFFLSSIALCFVTVVANFR